MDQNIITDQETSGIIISVYRISNFFYDKYQLQQELKRALYNRKQESGKYFLYEDYITIEYNDQFDWIYAEWKGDQTENSVMKGCEKLLEAARVFHCSKILNDNTNLADMWKPASAWVDNNWLPRTKEAGVKFFAWVHPAANMSRASTEESIRDNVVPDIVHTFKDIESAKRWLNSK